MGPSVYLVCRIGALRVVLEFIPMNMSAALALSAFLFFGSSQDKPHLSELQIALEGRGLTVSVQLVNGFSDQLLAEIQTGLASGFTYQFVLSRDQPLWFENKLDKSRLEVTAMYNAVTREYLINFKQDGKLIDSRIARSREELEREMTQISNLKVFQLESTNPNRWLVVRARADLGSKTTLLIIPSRIRTDWVRSRKFYPPSNTP